MSMQKKRKIAIMDEILEDFGSGQVMTNISPGDVADALKLVDTFSVDKAIRDAAIAAVDGLENAMRARNMNPSDFARIDELPEKVLKRIQDELKKESDYFLDIFKDHLANRG